MSKKSKENGSLQSPVKNDLLSRSLWLPFFLTTPKYWILGVILLMGRLITLLPLSWLLKISSALGKLLYLTSSRLKHISRVNVKTCFPEIPETERNKIVKKSFIELGRSLIETLIVWLGSDSKLDFSKIKVIGEENFRKALSKNKGIVLLGCHSGSTEMNGAVVSSKIRPHRAFNAAYKQPQESILDDFLRKARRNIIDSAIPANNLRGILKALKNKEVVWYLTDIETRGRNMAFVDFFGVPALTSTALTKITQHANALVLPFGVYLNSSGVYELHFFPVLEDVPSGNELTDAKTMNESIETIIRKKPESYWWVLKRFRYRPEGYEPLY